MSAGFTPGPWATNKAWQAHPRYGIFTLKNVVLAKAWTIEDAHLIAAAPELYEACLAVEQYITELGPFADDGTSPAPVFQRLSAALAKARGEA